MIQQKNRSPYDAKRLTRTAAANVLRQIESLPTFESIKPARRMKKLDAGREEQCFDPVHLLSDDLPESSALIIRRGLLPKAMSCLRNSRGLNPSIKNPGLLRRGKALGK